MNLQKSSLHITFNFDRTNWFKHVLAWILNGLQAPMATDKMIFFPNYRHARQWKHKAMDFFLTCISCTSSYFSGRSTARPCSRGSNPNVRDSDLRHRSEPPGKGLAHKCVFSFWTPDAFIWRMNVFSAEIQILFCGCTPFLKNWQIKILNKQKNDQGHSSDCVFIPTQQLQLGLLHAPFVGKNPISLLRLFCYLVSPKV